MTQRLFDDDDPWKYDPMNGDVRQQVRGFIERVHFDTERGIAILRSDDREVELDTLTELQMALETIAKKEGSDMGYGSLGEYMGTDGSLLYPPASHLVGDELQRSLLPRLFALARASETQNLILSLYPQPADVPRALSIQLASMSETLAVAVARNPSLLDTIEWGRFEDLMAELFVDEGYEVIQTPKRKDLGRDFLAFYREPFGTILTIVECKRYAREHKVGVALVRQLHSVLERDRANRAILATTSYFTQGARELAVDLKYRLSLRDYDDVLEWCKRFAAKRET